MLWKDGSFPWIPLKYLKESNIVEVVEHAKTRGIDGEPTFACWVPCTLRKRDAIEAAATTRARNMSHECGT